LVNKNKENPWLPCSKKSVSRISR